jgi:subtilisin family serine protease
VFRAAQDAAPRSGLFLIQFTDHFDSTWREALAARNVELIRYVPDDAYVARLRGVQLEELRALPFVQWVGEFRPEHKIHRLVRDSVQAGNARATLEVAVLCSPTATPAEMAEARGRLAQVHQQTRNRFGAVLRGRLAPGQLQKLAESPSVLWIEPAPRMKLNDEISTKLVAGDGPEHLAYVHQFGFNGTNVTVAVADSGLHLGDPDDMHPDLAGRTPTFIPYGLTDASDEHGHGTHVAGIIAGSGALGTVDELGYLYGLGVAPGASIVTQRIFDGNGGYTFTGPDDTFEKLTHDAVRAGAVIGNNSWGDDTQGRYDISAHEFDALVRDADWETPGDQQYILEFSAGNAGPGPQTIGSPAVAKNVIASGASQNDRFDFFIYADGSETMADFSSRGPCEDGRIKPDVVAPGTWIASLRSPVGNDENAWADIDYDYLYMGGTSQAGPQVSGAAAVFVQYYRETYAEGTPSPALVKAALIHSAVNMDDSFDTAATPNMDEGWGRVDLTEIIRSPRTQEYLDQSVRLITGQFYERSVIIADTNEPLKITLVYTDVPGFPGAIPALVNDLDLEVAAPDGRIYRGNQFERGESVPDATSSDNINNVEGVYIGVPQPGEYLVRVRARNVWQDARSDTPGVFDQDFALVVSGDIRSLETGIVLLDRPSYTAPSQIKIKLFDLDLAGMNSATVTVFSATEPAGQKVVLRPPTANSISFTGAIATATIVTTPQTGRLRIAHGNWIRVEYFDASEHVTNIANAVADLVPPVITNVFVTNQFGQTLITWTTDEQANSVVRFNTNATLSRAMTNSFRTTSHEMELRNLVPGQRYYFVVTSTDAAGNTATNSNGGVPYEFVAPEAAAVLLVDAYVPTEFGETFIPLSTYTSPLDQIGVTYDVWNTESMGMPVYADLSPYRIVMWRVNDSLYAVDGTIPLPQQGDIQQYLNNGGAFFMAGMDIISRLLETGGASFVTNVLYVRRFDRGDPLCFCHCEDCDEDFRVPTAVGASGDVIGDGFAATLDYSNYPSFEELDYGPDFGDTFGVATNATAILFEQVSRKACGMRYPRTGQDSTGRVVFVAFPLDSIPESGPSPNNRTEFLRRALQFLSPGLNGLGSVAFSQVAYKLPDQLTIEVGDSDLAGSAGAVVQVSSTTQPSPITMTLTETPQRGLFRGFLSLVSVSTTGKLQAANGDTIYAKYNDASGQGVITAMATVDVDPVLISNRNEDPQYQDAIIYWDTSEPADALVQFGESTFLEKTAYVSDLETSHAVQLTGLIPDRTYYYRIVSRDAAGNTTEDPANSGPLHYFRTLKPIKPPFIDYLQDGGTNWSVFNGEGSQFQWELGSPNNGHVAVPAPLNDFPAWASSLQGLSADYIDTFLVSPAIDLTGGNVAHLKFSHAYDFGYDESIDFINGGELLIVTNSVSAPATLEEYFDATPGMAPWELAEFDLTPYLGNVIFLVWHHQLLSIDAKDRPGWVIDGISVTVSNIPPCRIQITNNLAQARVSVAGPVSRTGQGYWIDLTNLPPGRYVTTWTAVPYYRTPAPQTNVLDSDGLIELTGNYTFPDANMNGISDTWEQQFFGGTNQVHTCQTDADGDGFSDCAEFIAGTNPTNALSHLRLYPPSAQPNFKVLFQWPTVPGRIYQLQSTYDFEHWIEFSPWMRANNNTLSIIRSAPEPGDPYAYRVEVRP